MTCSLKASAEYRPVHSSAATFNCGTPPPSITTGQDITDTAHPLRSSQGTGMFDRIGYCVVIALLAVGTTTNAGAPKLQRLTPQAAQRGSTADIELRGLFLDDPQDVLFYEPGVSVESIEVVTEQIVDGRPITYPSGTRLRVRLNVSDECPLGPVGMRVQTAGGLSDYQRLFVSPFVTVNEAEDSRIKNDEPNNAQLIAGNTTIVGSLREAYDLDLFRIAAKRGQRISAEIIAARIGVERGLPDLHVAILDAQGKLLQEADDSALYLQDPVLSMVAPEDGDYLVAVRHSLYGANNDAYLLHVGDFARPTVIYPAGGPAGAELSVQLFGDPLGVQTQSLRLPEAVTVGLTRRVLDKNDLSHDFHWESRDSRTNAFAPTPNAIRVSPFENILESGANDSPDEVAHQAAVELPIAFNGIIEAPGDVDYFKFAAKKGQSFRIHALASGLGTPVDPRIWISPASGKGATSRATDSRIQHHGLPTSNGVERVTVDPILQFTAPADGAYVLGIEDERGGGGDEYVYRIECQAEPNAAFVYIPPEPENRFSPQTRQVINVPAGGRYNTTLSIVNTNRAYQGDLELVAVGLPEGVEMHAPRITPELTRVPVVFSATENASSKATFTEIFARPAATEEVPHPEPLISGFRQHLTMNSLGNNQYYLHIPLEKLAVAVTEPAAFDLSVEEPRSALVQNGEMPLRFNISRRDGYQGPVTVMMEWKPNGINTVTPLSLSADEEEGEYLISAARNATAGTYLVTLTAVNGNYQPQYRDPNERTYVSCKPFSLTVAEPHLEARFARASVERGKTSVLVVTLNHLKPFSGLAKVALTRLPRGVEVLEEYREISSGDKEVSFTLKATTDSLVGSYRGMTLDVTIDDNGQAVRQFTGSGTLRVDAQRGGKPAS